MKTICFLFLIFVVSITSPLYSSQDKEEEAKVMVP